MSNIDLSKIKILLLYDYFKIFFLRHNNTPFFYFYRQVIVHLLMNRINDYLSLSGGYIETAARYDLRNVLV